MALSAQHPNHRNTKKYVDGNLDFSNQNLEFFPEDDFYVISHIKFCYMEGNSITSLPDAFFRNLPLLEWLDMRKNNLTALPTVGLAGHKNLQVLLLSRNRIKILPSELAHVPFLNGLQISGNPIENIPFNIMTSGLTEIIRHLRKNTKSENEPESILPVCETIITNNLHKSGNNTITNRKERSTNSRKDLIPDASPKRSKRNFLASGIKSCRHNTKLVTAEIIADKQREQLEKSQLRELLAKQSQLLQRLKDAEAIKCWRKMTDKKTSMKLLDNYQYSPSQNFLNKSPFDVDPEMMRMLNRQDLYKSIKELESYEQRVIAERRKSTRASSFSTIGDLENKIQAIKQQLEELDLNASINQEHNDVYKKSLIHRIEQIKKLRQVLLKLQGDNNGQHTY